MLKVHDKTGVAFAIAKLASASESAREIAAVLEVNFALVRQVIKGASAHPFA